MNVQKRSCSILALCAFVGFSSVAFASAPQLRLVGTAIFQGEASALVEDATTGEQSFVSVNDNIQGCTIKEILPGRLMLDASGKTYELASASLPSAVEPLTIQSPVMKKQAPISIQSKSSKSVADTKSSSRSLSFSLPMSGRVVSGFGQRKDPWGGSTKTHHGVDIAAPHGTRIKAAAGGTVKVATYAGLYGRHVIIDHGNGYETVYAHLYRSSVKAGQDVSRGQVIGYEGSTGRSTGPHLHFEIRKNGTPVDPANYISSLDQ